MKCKETKFEDMKYDGYGADGVPPGFGIVLMALMIGGFIIGTVLCALFVVK